VAAGFTALLDPYVEKANTFYMDRVEDAVILLHALGQYTDQLVRRCHRRMASPHPNLILDAAPTCTATSASTASAAVSILANCLTCRTAPRPS
jgi:hypothetical protein